ncbi:MAG: replication initiation protein [Cetobacterium sp.]|uniref:replication initiation protein n=1 Tax=Cetobacterium sp. TaxID=2071632 RepID=UPI003F2FA561
MEKELKYHNEINKLKISEFSENEVDIFFSLLFKAKETGDDEIIITFAELKKIAELGNRSETRFIKNIRELNKKLKSMTQEIECEKGVFKVFSLFGTITTDTNKKIIIVPIEKEFKFLINGILENFTIFDLKEFLELRGSYMKTLFRLLKQWESTGEYIVKINDFREVLGIPIKYRMIDMRKRVLKPCLEELSKYFKDLKITELKKGRNVETLIFTWKNKKKKKDNIIDIPPVKKRKIVLGEKELQEHEREQLENTIQELEKKKKVKNIPSDPVVELKKICKKDYENLYKDYLERLGEQHNLYMKKSFDFINRTKYEIIEDMEIEQQKEKSLFTEKDIDESLLVSKTGKKLVGMARQYKIKKLLEDLNNV